MPILATLWCAGLRFKTFRNAEFRTALVEQMGAEPQGATPAHVGYEVRTPRRKGLIRKIAGATGPPAPGSGTAPRSR